MSLEGRLRDLALTEVLQLLALGRKSGVLHCHAPLQGRRARIAFEGGAIVHADVVGADGVPDRHGGTKDGDERAAVDAAVQDVLLWRDGLFRFAPGEQPWRPTAVRIAVEPLLMTAAVRAEVWQRIESRVPHARVVPTFVETEPQQLPLLRLTPPQWDLLTRVDGQRDLMALASAMNRDVTEVAMEVHDLIVAGLLTLRGNRGTPRRNPTPPAVAAIPDDGSEEDSLFDPVGPGARTPRGLRSVTPTWRTAPVALPPVAPSPAVAAPVAPSPVAPSPSDPSMLREPRDTGTPASAGARSGRLLSQQGDERARAGDLAGAIALWQAALGAPAPPPDVERVREALALATRLHALLSA